MAEKFTARLEKAKLATKGDVTDFVKNCFDEKFKNINKKLTLNRTRHLEVKKKKKKMIHQ